VPVPVVEGEKQQAGQGHDRVQQAGAEDRGGGQSATARQRRRQAVQDQAFGPDAGSEEGFGIAENRVVTILPG
jgi:hypothetical protein